jgi:hypothetical protein
MRERGEAIRPGRTEGQTGHAETEDGASEAAASADRCGSGIGPPVCAERTAGRVRRSRFIAWQPEPAMFASLRFFVERF